MTGLVIATSIALQQGVPVVTATAVDERGESCYVEIVDDAGNVVAEGEGAASFLPEASRPSSPRYRARVGTARVEFSGVENSIPISGGQCPGQSWGWQVRLRPHIDYTPHTLIRRTRYEFASNLGPFEIDMDGCQRFTGDLICYLLVNGPNNYVLKLGSSVVSTHCQTAMDVHVFRGSRTVWDSNPWCSNVLGLYCGPTFVEVTSSGQGRWSR